MTVTYAAAPSGPYGDTPPSYRNAGRYTIYFRAEQNGWYPYYGQAELLIGRAGLTVVPLPDQEKFTGQADPELRYTYRGAIPGETPAFTGALSRESGEAPGRYAIDSGSLALADGDGFRADNYTLTCEKAPFSPSAPLPRPGGSHPQSRGGALLCGKTRSGLEPGSHRSHPVQRLYPFVP